MHYNNLNNILNNIVIHRTNKAKSRFIMSPTISKVDILKFIVLSIFIGGMLMSAVFKFGDNIFGNNSIKLVEIKLDTTICDKVKDCLVYSSDICPLTYSECNGFMSDTFNESKRKCKGYIDTWNSCQRKFPNNRRNICSIELSNTESCFTAITKTSLNNWDKYKYISQDS